MSGPVELPVEKDKEEMQEVLDRMQGWLYDHKTSTRYAGMTFEDGIKYALEWAMGACPSEEQGWPFDPKADE